MLGLEEDGVGYAMDDNNKALVTAEMKAAVDKAAADIISGAIKVHDYMSDDTCPAVDVLATTGAADTSRGTGAAC